MDDKELLIQCYHTMYRGMIEKDMDYIANGTLNYYSEKTEHMEITVAGEHAKLVGQSRVNAAVFGGGKHVWSLQLSMRAVKRNGKWYMTEAAASTY